MTLMLTILTRFMAILACADAGMLKEVAVRTRTATIVRIIHHSRFVLSFNDGSGDHLVWQRGILDGYVAASRGPRLDRRPAQQHPPPNPTRFAERIRFFKQQVSLPIPYVW